MIIRKASFVVAFVAVLALLAGSAQAQDKSSWGAQISFGQQWQILPLVEKLFQSDSDLTGREVRVGVVRGRKLGGDWGVSYTYNKINDTSFVQTSSGRCGGYPTAEYYRCFNVGTTYQLHGVSFGGLEAHKYVPFVTIAEHAQIGVNIAGGVVWVKGSAEKRMTTVNEVNEMPARKYYVQAETVSSVLAVEAIKEEIGSSMIPMIRAEAVVAVILNRGLKIKASIGIGALGYSRFNIGTTYLF